MEESLACEWYASNLLIVSENVGPFIYYTHLLPLIASVLLGVFVLWNDRRSLTHWALFSMTMSFSVWVYFDLILWASPTPESVMFFWSSIVPIEMLIYASGLYLVYLFANGQRDISLHKKLTIALFFVPIVLFAHTRYNVLGLSYDCDVGAIEGPLIQYMYLVEMLFIIWTAAVAMHAYRRISNPNARAQLVTVALGTLAFMLSFTAGNITLIFSVGPQYEQYKLFGMPIFAGFIAYSMVALRTFNAKLIGAQVLVASLAILIFSLLFIRTIENVRIITWITFVLVCVLGYILVKNVQREIRLRVQIQAQEEALENINKQQEGLLRFISHEVKGYLTKGQAAFAGIAQGDYGAITPELQHMADNAIVDARKGVDMVADILDASNLRKGTVSYTKAPFDFKKSVGQVMQDLTPSAEAKKIALSFSAASGSYVMEGDEVKIRRHVIRNLIDNALHYTPNGEIRVSLSRSDNHLRFSVKDTGVGITKEDMQRLFTEGGHGKESTKVNIDSTGYGLFIAKQITEVHGGTIQALSQGAGQGSEFVVELPM